jgi:hypothetical protein
VCATLDASKYGNGTTDATADINSAIQACPAGQVVRLSAGTFLINADIVMLSKDNVVLRGAGAGQTILKRTNGAVPGDGNQTPAVLMPVVIIGPQRWAGPDDATSQNLTTDGTKGTYSVIVSSASGFSKGQFVLLDEMTKGAWKALPNRNGAPTTAKIWANDRVNWMYHNPDDQVDDPVGPAMNADLTGSGASWFSRQDRPISEIKEIASVNAQTITFKTPLHITYRASHTAQLTALMFPPVQGAGVENLTVNGGSDGNFRFVEAVRCWAKNVENTTWIGEGFAMESSYRVVVRDSYVHDAAWPVPGGGAYAISFQNGVSEALVENNISINVNKVVVSRCSGAGSVVGYNYLDNGIIMYNPQWMESGANGSHMVGAHHMLFEGNYAFNGDSDDTHGSSIYHTFFRNHFSGHRLGGTVYGTAISDSPDQFQRCVSAAYGSKWMTFVGNVLGLPGKMGSWVYEVNGDNGMASPYDSASPPIWELGVGSEWDQAGDPDVLSTVIRDGNYDYLTNSVHWHTTPGYAGTLQNSLYLKSKPAFFGSSRWPWVEPLDSTQLYTLPAKARYDGGTPNSP